MKIKLPNGEDLELVYSFRSNVYFEQMNGKAVDFNNLSANDLLVLYYCVFIASLQKAKMPIISMIDFLDIIDDNGGDNSMLEFAQWYVSVIQAQYEVMSETDTKSKKNKGAKKK